MKKLLVSSSLLMAIIAPTAVFAQNDRLFQQNTSSGADVYAAGQGITISEEISGDLYIAGQSIDINARIGQDLGAVGQAIHIMGEIGDDLRAAGQIVTISGKVGDSVTAAGQQIRITNGSDIGGDLWATGEMIEINAPVHGDIKLHGSRIMINAQIDGNADIVGGEIVFGENGFIQGDLKERVSEKSPQEKVGGRIDYSKRVTLKPEESFFQKQVRKLWSPSSVIFLISTLLVGALFLYLAGIYFAVSAENTRKSPFVSLGIGFLMLIGIPAMALILMITVIGLPLGAVILLGYFALLLFAGIIEGLFIGAFVVPIDHKSNFWNMFGSFTVGTLIIFLLSLIPYFGAVIKFLIFLVALGSVGRSKFQLAQHLRKEKRI